MKKLHPQNKNKKLEKGQLNNQKKLLHMQPIASKVS